MYISVYFRGVQMKKPVTIELLLVRFGVRMLCLSSSACALSVQRAAIGEATHSDTGRHFYEAGPADCIELVSDLLSAAMHRGELPRSDARLAACQFMALMTAETRSRLFESAPRPLMLSQIRSIARRAVQAFLVGAASHPADHPSRRRRLLISSAG
jgi:hypothetical protein